MLVLINVILPYLIFIRTYFTLGNLSNNIDGKQVELVDMIMVLVK